MSGTDSDAGGAATADPDGGPPSPDARADDAAAAVDDCWNRIGIRGDRSCPRLAEHVHCRNCPVHGRAAIRMLDRHDSARRTPAHDLPGGGQADEGQTDDGVDGVAARRRFLVFRLGGEWLGLPSRRLLEVTPVAMVHSLPHQRQAAILGVTNVRGTLAACISLARFLDVVPAQDAATDTAGSGRRTVPRTLILNVQDGPIAVPVDEVEGIHPLTERAVAPVSPDGARPIGRFAVGVLQWRGRSVTLLDDSALVAALVGSLA